MAAASSFHLILVSSNSADSQPLLPVSKEHSISDKKLQKAILSIFAKTPLSEFNAILQWNREDYLIKKCLEKLGQPLTDQETLVKRIQHFVKTTQKIDQETLDCLFLEGDWLDQIYALAPRNESGYVAYVKKLCDEEVETIRAKIKAFSKEELKEAIKKVLKDKEFVREMKTEFSSSQDTLEYLIDLSCYELLKPEQLSLEKTLEKLKTKTFLKEELEQKGLPGSRNMLPDLFEDGVAKKAIYKSMEIHIFDQFLKKESDHLHRRIERIIQASPTVMKKLGFKVEVKVKT